MTSLRFTVPTLPTAQPRQRHAVIAGCVRNYTPTKHPVNAFKTMVRTMAASAYRDAPYEGPVRLDAVLVFPRPKGKRWKTKPMPRYWHKSKPDRNNCEKALEDALTGIVWHDDSQVCCGETIKLVAAGDEQPHVDVRITFLEAGQPRCVEWQ